MSAGCRCAELPAFTRVQPRPTSKTPRARTGARTLAEIGDLHRFANPARLSRPPSNSQTSVAGSYADAASNATARPCQVNTQSTFLHPGSSALSPSPEDPGVPPTYDSTISLDQSSSEWEDVDINEGSRIAVSTATYWSYSGSIDSGNGLMSLRSTDPLMISSHCRHTIRPSNSTNSSPAVLLHHGHLLIRSI